MKIYCVTSPRPYEGDGYMREYYPSLRAAKTRALEIARELAEDCNQEYVQVSSAIYTTVLNALNYPKGQKNTTIGEYLVDFRKGSDSDMCVKWLPGGRDWGKLFELGIEGGS